MRPIFYFLESEIDQLEKFLKFSDIAMKRYRDDFENFLTQKSKDMNENQREEFLSNYIDKQIEVNFQFPSMFFASFVVTWFSFMEINLLEICKRLDAKITVSTKEKLDIRDGIDRAKTFLNKGLNYNFDKDVWEEINHIRKMRNILVHKLGAC